MRFDPLVRALATASCAAALLLALALPVHAEPPRLTLDDITEESIDTEVEPPPPSPDLFERLGGDALAEIELYLSDPEAVRQQLYESTGIEDPEVLAIPALCLVAVLLGLLLVLSGRGDLIVSIEYPAELRGTFSVRLSRRKADVRKRERTSSPSEALQATRKSSSSTRTERHLISRETDFRDIRSGRWTVTVDGFLQTQDDETVIVTHFEQREVRLRRGETVRIDFDFQPRQCPVDVRVSWDKRPTSDALLAWYGQPHSLRYVRGGPVRMGATQGEHKLIVGSGDRVAELTVPVESFQPTSVEVDLADRDQLIFTGCPLAVEPYLHGDVPAAARALEREGQQEVASLLLARLHAEFDQGDAAARHFEQAGRTNEAAEIHAGLGHHAEAGALFESAGDLPRAAESYLLAGDQVKAGETFERARQFDRAVECYRDSNSFAKWVEALEKSGAPYEAAQVAIERNEWGRAIRSLQMVTHVDPEFIEAANTLVDAYQREGHLDLAARKVEDIIRAKGAESVPLEACDKLATALEESDEIDRAVDMLEIIRRRDATYPNVATRIETLRKQRHEKAIGGNSIPGAADFASGFRYEILEEIGRGGMGIVFKARDRRLGRLVALKRLPDDLRNHPKAISLFLGEARAAAILNHPNIVTLFDAGQEGDTLYITMELLEGRPLAEILSQRGRLGTRDVARLGVQIGYGLECAHGEGIVHRDIKTANLFFTKSKALKIMDFGLAKVMEEVRRASTVVGGTPYYMAPEQSLGEPVDGRADLYALGVTFFELLTGGVPFPDGDVAYHHRHTPPPDPREKVPELCDDMAELVLQMLGKQPDDRPASAAEVVTRLQDIINAVSDVGG